MNISGPQYAKAVKGLRNAVHITDQQFKLMFIYPILLDKSLSTYESDFRSFISISILKELFISNSINMVNMASQVHPLTDERGQSFDTTKITGNVELSRSSGYSSSSATEVRSRSYDTERNKEELKSQVKKRTALIKKLLDSDPRFSQYKPYLELITMDNFIDVPVIVGTKSYLIDTLTTTFVMLVSIAQDGRLKLDSEQNVKQIFATINDTKEKDAWKLLSNVTALPDKQKGPVLKWWLSQVNKVKLAIKPKLKELKSFAKEKIYNIPGAKAAVQQAREAKGLYNTLTKTQETPEDTKPPDDVYNINKKFDNINPDDAMNILNIAKSDVDQVELFFKFCVNHAASKSMHGTTQATEQVAEMYTNKREDIMNVFNNLTIRYMKAINEYARPLIYSFVYTFLPITSNIDISNLIDTSFLTPMFEKVKTFSTNTLYAEIEKNLGQSSVDADSNIKELKGLCTGEFRNLDSVAAKLGSEIERNKLSIGMGNLNKIKNFALTLDDVATQSSAYSKNGEFALKKIVKTFKALETPVVDMITQGLYEIFRILYHNEADSDITLIPAYKVLMVPADQATISKMSNSEKAERQKTGSLVYDADSGAWTMRKIVDEMDLLKYYGDFASQISSYLYFLYMYSLQAALCELVNVVDLSIEAAKNSVLTFPNYTLIIPVESVIAVANAFAAKGWKNLVSFDTSRQFFKNLNENYVIGVVKYISLRLGVPNIIVVDKKKGEMYFKLMYQSKPQKMKLDALKTYINNGKEITLDSTSNSSSYF